MKPIFGEGPSLHEVARKLPHNRPTFDEQESLLNPRQLSLMRMLGIFQTARRTLEGVSAHTPHLTTLRRRMFESYLRARKMGLEDESRSLLSDLQRNN